MCVRCFYQTRTGAVYQSAALVIWDGLGKAWQLATDATENPATQFAILVNAVPSSYHGQNFKCNKCRCLLKSLDKLDAAVPPLMGTPFLKCLRDLDVLVGSCFSVATLLQTTSTTLRPSTSLLQLSLM